MLFGNIANPTMFLPVKALVDDVPVAVEDGVVVVVVVGAVVVLVAVVVVVVGDVVVVVVVVVVATDVVVVVVDVDVAQLLVFRQLAAVASIVAIATYIVAVATTTARRAIHRRAFDRRDNAPISLRLITDDVVSTRDST